eukprot:jgi/Undpi1/14018/HiC_scaffold_9.g03669.m1
MGRRRPRERRATAALLALVLSRPAARALCPSSLARTNNSNALRASTRPQTAATGATSSSLPRGRASHLGGRSTVAGAGTSWRLQAAGYGTAFGAGRNDDDGSDDDELERGDESDAQMSAAAATAAAATAAADARAAAAARAAPSEVGNDSLKPSVLQRMRRRSEEKIKASTPSAAVLEPASSRRSKRAAAAPPRNSSNSTRENKKRRIKGKGRNINLAGSGDRDGGSGDRDGGIGRGLKTGGRERKSWAGAVCNAVFGTPKRFVQRRVEACKAFVESRERVHWASLGMAIYILTTSVVPRLGTG